MSYEIDEESDLEKSCNQSQDDTVLSSLLIIFPESNLMKKRLQA